MKISYAITVCNELEEIKRLINFLHQHKRPEDEICVLLDKPKASPELLYQLSVYFSEGFIILTESEFKGHFADWKNQLMDLCSGDYIFQIDADELPNEYLIKSLSEILETNSSVEAYVVPRVNTIEGLTPEHIAKWGWKVQKIDNKDLINFPDWQHRIFKNDGSIKWKNKVHEVLEGHKTLSYIPAELFLWHHKDIKRQEKQNAYYESL